nr:hypothetical protein [Tanacetum cinerariifolium]
LPLYLTGLVVDSDPKKDEKDPKEDPADYLADIRDNDDDDSSNDDEDDDDVEKDEEDKEEEEHLAPAYPSDEMMTTVNQGMSVEEIKRVVAQRVAIAIYETKTNLACKSMSQTERQEEKDDDDVDEDDKEEEEEEEEHLAPADSTAFHVVDHVSSAEDTEAFKTDESASTHVPSPRHHTIRMSVRSQTSTSATVEALIAEYASAPTSPLPP